MIVLAVTWSKLCLFLIDFLLPSYSVQVLISTRTVIAVLPKHSADMVSTTLSTTIWRLVDRKASMLNLVKASSLNISPRIDFHMVMPTANK